MESNFYSDVWIWKDELWKHNTNNTEKKKFEKILSKTDFTGFNSEWRRICWHEAEVQDA